MTVVLDCNIFVMSFTSRSPFHNIYKIVTEDKHFDILQSIPFPPLNIISIEAFSALV